MVKKIRFSHVALFVILLGITALPVLAGSAVVGSVAGSINATVGGQVLLPNTTIFSGDSVRVKDGVAVLAVGSGSRMVFGRETSASFLRESGEVTVLLAEGSVTIFHANDSVALRVKAGDAAITPAKGFKTLGEVAMLNGSLVVTAKEGALRVERNGETVEVAKGKTLTIVAKTARAPQGSAGSTISSGTALQAASVGAGGVAAVLSGVAISRAGDAKDAGNAAASNANSATSAANSAKSSADAATAAANAAAANANLVGCALNAWANSLDMPSPYTPPAGMSCQ